MDTFILAAAPNFLLTRRGMPMALFRRKKFLLPEIMLVIAVNVVAAVLVYYAIVLWALYRQ